MIKRITCRGFKSFANKTELVFGKGFNCIIGPNGSGKSLKGDSLVLLEDGSTKQIKELVENALSNSESIKKLEDGIYTESKQNQQLLSVDPLTFKNEYKKITKYIRHNGEKNLFEITTRTGKKITTTGCHSILIFKDNCINSTRVDQLKENALIALPRIIKTLPKENIKLDLEIAKDKTAPKIITPNYARFLGYVIGDGYLNQRLEIVNSDEELIKDFKTLAKELFDIDNFYTKKTGITYRLINNSSYIKKFFQKLFKSDNLTGEYKSIPEEFMKADNEVIRNLIAGLYDTDGYVSKTGNQIEFSNKNEKLVSQIQELLLRFGIISFMKSKYKYASNTEKKIKRRYYFLHTSDFENLEKFYTNIPLRVKHKKERLENYVSKTIEKNTNTDLLPQEINHNIKETVKLLGLKVKNLRKEYPSLASYYENRCNPTRYKLNELLYLFKERWAYLYQVYYSLEKKQESLITNLEKINISGRSTAKVLNLSTNTINVSWKGGVFKARPENLEKLYNYEKEYLIERLNKSLKILFMLTRTANSDIFWDQIIKIEKIKGEKYVYDIEVEDNHNFIANGIFVHNSNVVDSLCFVLGKSSAKDMRAEKSANLIYNGGKKHSPSKEAEVIIEFDNSDSLFPINTKEVVVTRTVKPNGNSIYQINGDVRTRQQVVDMLRGAKLDPDGHNIILQGDIIGFMEMKPTDRRLIIEEISGISMYEEKKDKCLLELQKVDGSLNEAEIILTEREANLRELKKERDQATRYKEIQDEIKNHKATQINLQIKAKQEKVNEIENKKKEAEDKINKVNATIADIKKQILDFKEQIKTINDEIEVKGEKEQIILRKEIEDLKTGIIKLNSRIEVCQNQITQIKTRKEQLSNNIIEINEKIKVLNVEKEEHGKKLKTLNEEDITASNKIIQFKEKNGIDTDFSVTLEKLDKEIDQLNDEVNKTNENKQNSLRNKDQLTFKLASIIERIENIKGSSADMDSLKNKKKLFKEITEKLSTIINEDSSYAAQLGKHRYDLNQRLEELAKLKSRQISIQERSYGDLAIRKIIELGSSLPGIHGTVSELGKVDTKYSLALEVAAGPRAQSIVVDTDHTAERCIEHLKQNKLGTATFLPLNKIKSRVTEPIIKQLLNQTGVHGLAVSLIKYDKQYEDIFSYVLGQTLVVDNVTTARKIGIGRTRMVTLEGDLMESSGAMIGGYRHQRAGFGFKEKETEENIIRLEEELQKLRTLVGHIEHKKTENEIELVRLRGEKANLEGEIITTEKTLNISGIDVTTLMNDKKELNEQIKEHDKTLNEFENKIKELYEKIEEEKAKRQKLKEKLNNPEIARTLEGLEQQKSKIKEGITEHNNGIKNIEMQITTILESEKEKTTKIIKQHEKENEEFLKEVMELKEGLKKKEQELKIKEGEESKFHNTFKDLIAKRNKINEKIQALETNTAREDEKLKGFEQKLNGISIDRAKEIAEFEGLQKEFEQYTNAVIKRGLTLDDLKIKINEFEKELIKIGNVNLRALEVYESIEKEYQAIIEKVTKLKSEKEDVLKMMSEIELRKKEIFMKSYNKVVKTFKEIYSELTTKGEAHVMLENEENPFEGGIDIEIKIAGSKVLDIKSLSGGEKTMAALSFIFAIQEHSPSPFYLLDEVDAALDKTNSELLSKLIAKYAHKAQYIVISHNDNIITEAEYIYGISMGDGISKVVSLKV